MTWPVIIKQGKNLNATISSIKYDYYGQQTPQQIFFCDTWAEGFALAKQTHTHALFVNSGTVFTDWYKWKTLVDTYPHQGLVAHLIWHPEKELYIDDQCWFVKLDNFELTDLVDLQVTHPTPVRSAVNIHNEYTPLWLCPGSDQITYTTSKFGQGLIAKQLNLGLGVVNWNNSARAIKQYLYKDSSLAEYKDQVSDYIDLAEHQLYIFNNEEINIQYGKNLLTPGSGLYWILHAVQPLTEQIQIVDISSTQIQFAKEVWSDWDGNNYGEFVWNFITRNKLKHYEFDQANLSQLERLKLKNKSRFIKYVNNKFELLLAQHNINNFVNRWQQTKNKIQVNFTHANLVNWVLDRPSLNYDIIWTSNILSYKWTLLTNTHDEFTAFKKIIYEKTAE